MIENAGLTLLSIIGLYFITSILLWIYRRHQIQKIFQKHGIPGPEPKFLPGNLHQIKAAPTPNDVISKWLKEYGNVFGYFIGEVPYMVIRDPAMLKQVLIRDFHNFSNRAPVFISAKPIIYGVLFLRNPRWKDVRSTLTPTFSSSKIKLMFKSMKQKVSTTVEVVTEKALQEESFDFYEIAQSLTLEVIADCALAMKINCQKNLNDPLLLAVRSYMLEANNKAVEYAIMFPMLRIFFGFLASYMTAGRMTDMIVHNLKKVIQYRRNNPMRGTDLLQLMLDSCMPNDKTPGNNKAVKKAPLTDGEIIGNALVSLLAGYDTTGTTLAFTFYLLVQHPDVQEKLYQEIIDNCPDDDEFTYEVLNSLQYLDQVLNESMRIYPPVTGFVTRQCSNECIIGQYTIPSGVVIQAPIWDIHHDPELWPDPWKFDPERFSPENKTKIDSTSFMPFGSGPRNCIGMRFALLEAKLALCFLVKKFKFIPCEKTEDPLTLICPTVIITPKNGVFLKATLREPL